jgi:phosphohistidine swiveling domain-containing protein
MNLQVAVNLEIFSKDNWTETLARPNQPFFNSLLRTGVQVRNRELAFDNTVNSQLLLNPRIYSLKQEVADLEERLVDVIRNDEYYLSKYFDQLASDCKAYLEQTHALALVAASEKNKGQLLDLLVQYRDATVKILSHGYPPLIIEQYIIKELENRLTRLVDPQHDFAKFNDLMQVLTKPEEPSTFLSRKLTVLELASKLSITEINEDNQEVVAAYKKFKWLDDHTFTLEEETLVDFVKEILNAKKENPKTELDNIRQDFIDSKEVKTQLIKKYNLDADMVALCDLAQRLPNLRGNRLEVLLEAGHILKNNLFNNISAVLDIKDFTKYFYWELSDLLTGKNVDMKKIEARTLRYGFYVFVDDIYIFSEQEMVTIEKILALKIKNTQVIIGKIASKGFVKGRVRVVLNQSKFTEFQEGEILVTPMTTPDYVPLMKKSAAIVTDEGGISCHAAIISRELKKPCIIGTKIATQVLHDGDEVEVDADRGIIKILSSKR